MQSHPSLSSRNRKARNICLIRANRVSMKKKTSDYSKNNFVRIHHSHLVIESIFNDICIIYISRQIVCIPHNSYFFYLSRWLKTLNKMFWRNQMLNRWYDRNSFWRKKVLTFFKLYRIIFFSLLLFRGRSYFFCDQIQFTFPHQ